MRTTSPASVATLILVAFLWVLPASAQTTATTTEALSDQIAAIIDAPPISDAIWGVLVIDVETSDTLFARNEGKNFVPASNVKLYTSASVLTQLGPDYRYETEVYVDGPLEHGALDGNLIVRGSADPTIGRDKEEDRPTTELFEQWADSLRAAGITHIRGDIIGDDSVIDDTPLGSGWSWDNVPSRYVAELGGLVFSENVINFTLEGQAPGAPASISWEPHDTDFIQVVNSTRSVDADSSLDVEYTRARSGNLFRHASRIPEGRTLEHTLSITNSAQYFTHVLRETLLRSGISVGGQARIMQDLPIRPDYENPRLRRIATHRSAPLSEIITTLNKESQNLYAEQLLRTLGAERPVLDADEDLEPGTAAMGAEASYRMLAEAGVDTSRINLADGSGMSRFNLVAPDMTASLLTYMYNYPNPSVREVFYDSLPIGGEDGTLEYRFRNGRARGNVRAKTGTLSGVSALSGYVETAGGRTLVFVMMSNNTTAETSLIRGAQDAVVDLLTSFPR